MGQVPSKNSLLIVGSGRLARHLLHLLSLLGRTAYQWDRSLGLEQFLVLSQKCERIALLISDRAIANFFDEIKSVCGNKHVFHCSGSLVHPEMPSVHPLMTFGPELYNLDLYQSITWVSETGRSGLSEMLPELPNKEIKISPDKKGVYHALAVASGNFTTLLWSECLAEFERIGLPHQAVEPYLMQAARNAVSVGGSALTGPLQRGDLTTVQRNLESLRDLRLLKIYEAFLDWFPDLKEQVNERH